MYMVNQGGFSIIWAGGPQFVLLEKSYGHWLVQCPQQFPLPALPASGRDWGSGEEWAQQCCYLDGFLPKRLGGRYDWSQLVARVRGTYRYL